MNKDEVNQNKKQEVHYEFTRKVLIQIKILDVAKGLIYKEGNWLLTNNFLLMNQIQILVIGKIETN